MSTTINQPDFWFRLVSDLKRRAGDFLYSGNQISVYKYMPVKANFPATSKIKNPNSENLRQQKDVVQSVHLEVYLKQILNSNMHGQTQ